MRNEMQNHNVELTEEKKKELLGRVFTDNNNVMSKHEAFLSGKDSRVTFGFFQPAQASADNKQSTVDNKNIKKQSGPSSGP